MWIVFWVFLTPNVDQFTSLTWIIFRYFQPPSPLAVHMVYGCRLKVVNKYIYLEESTHMSIPYRRKYYGAFLIRQRGF